MDEKIKFMREALKRAKKGLSQGEVPVGAVIVYEGKVIASGYNRRTKTQMATSHAEMYAIDRACRKLKSWRLCDCDLYVTLEPCPMCMGAMLNARIRNLYFGAYEQKGPLDDGGTCGEQSFEPHARNGGRDPGRGMFRDPERVLQNHAERFQRKVTKCTINFLRAKARAKRLTIPEKFPTIDRARSVRRSR